MNYPDLANLHFATFQIFSPLELNCYRFGSSPFTALPKPRPLSIVSDNHFLEFEVYHTHACFFSLTSFECINSLKDCFKCFKFYLNIITLSQWLAVDIAVLFSFTFPQLLVWLSISPYVDWHLDFFCGLSVHEPLPILFLVSCLYFKILFRSYFIPLKNK